MWQFSNDLGKDKVFSLPIRDTRCLQRVESLSITRFACLFSCSIIKHLAELCCIGCPKIGVSNRAFAINPGKDSLIDAQQQSRCACYLRQQFHECVGVSANAASYNLYRHETCSTGNSAIRSAVCRSNSRVAELITFFCECSTDCHTHDT